MHSLGNDVDVPGEREVCLPQSAPPSAQRSPGYTHAFAETEHMWWNVSQRPRGLVVQSASVSQPLQTHVGVSVGAYPRGIAAPRQGARPTTLQWHALSAATARFAHVEGSSSGFAEAFVGALVASSASFVEVALDVGAAAAPDADPDAGDAAASGAISTAGALGGSVDEADDDAGRDAQAANGRARAETATSARSIGRGYGEGRGSKRSPRRYRP